MWCIGFSQALEEQNILGGQALNFIEFIISQQCVCLYTNHVLFLQILSLKIKCLCMILLGNGLDGQSMIVSKKKKKLY